MKVSLIISVYKNIDDLKIVLDNLRLQSYKKFDIIISEDGDFGAMRKFTESYQSEFGIIHLQQADEGWRKNKALNNAIRASNSEYLIFIDGDCVLHHKFIENHVRYARPERILAGKRIKLGAVYSDILRKGEPVNLFAKRIFKEYSALKKDGAKFYEEGLYVDPESILSFIPALRKMTMLKGCNMSCFKKALEVINGFDEDYQLPAIGEDIDLTWRFKGMGYSLFSLRNRAVQYHLHHKENWTDQSVNETLMTQKQLAHLYVCENGLSKRD